MLFHKFVWEPSYNIESGPRTTDPETSPEEWINFYADEEFYKANQAICSQDKASQMITKYKTKSQK